MISGAVRRKSWLISSRAITTAIAATAAAFTLAACGARGDGAAPDWQPVSFRASDGVRLEGRLYGGWREAAVIFSHMGRPGDTQADWYETAATLGRAGHAALTYNRRGVCPGSADGCSQGSDDLAESWRDVVGAYGRARGEGATRVVLVGASIGAMSSIKAASQDDVEIAALVEVGGINNASGYSFSKDDLAGIEGLKAFASSRGDTYGGADAAREWHSWARPPKRLDLLAGAEHGTDILRAESKGAERLTHIILDTVDEANR